MRETIIIDHDIPLPTEEPEPKVDYLPHSGSFTSETSRLANDARKEKNKLRKDKLSGEFLDDLYEAWTMRGKQALEAIAIHAPDKFVQVVANLVAKHDVITVEQVGGGLSIDAIGLQEVSRRTRELLSRAAARSDPAALPD